ncbi:MAG: hypothetical protein K8T90_17700 [Planctomycetes bacterium]|nr:hypothetical protein [Planctomycetota bacterium]
MHTPQSATQVTCAPTGLGRRRRRVGPASVLFALAGALLAADPLASPRAFADLEVSLASGDRVIGRLDPVSEVERHTLTCAEGTLITASVVAKKVPPSKVTAAIRVRLLDDVGDTLSVAGPGGAVATDVTGKRVVFRNVAAPRSGRVVLEVSAADGSSVAAAGYTLAVSLKPQTTWRTPTLAVSPSQPGLLTFAAPAGATVRFKAKAPAGVAPTFGRVLEDSTPTGTDFTGTAPAAAVFVAPTTGTFQLEVLGATDGVVRPTATVVAPKSRGRKLDVSKFADSGEGLLQTLDGTSPVDLAPDADGLEGFRVEIPGGVFPAGTILYVGPSPTLNPVGSFRPAGPAITISASSAFAKGATVTLTLPFDASAANGSTSGVAVTVRDDAGNISETTEGLVVDLTGGQVSFPASHFSAYQVVVAATPGIISTFAGTGAAADSGDGGPATAAGVQNPVGVAVAATGVVYISDGGGHSIRAVDLLGVISTVAGDGTASFAGDGGPASAARLNEPHAIFVDRVGALVVCDRGNHRLRRIDSSGMIATIAGDGAGAFAGDGSAATSASLNGPAGACADAAGNIYIADTYNHRLRRVDTSGTITTVAGNGVATFAGDGAAATSASIRFPTGVAVNAAGDIFIADNGNNRIRRIAASDGVISTIAGDGTPGLSGDGGPASAARLNIPFSVAFDIDGALLITEAVNNTVRRITVAGGIERVAGTGVSGFTGDDGPAVDATLDFPLCLTVDRAGTLYIAEYGNSRVRRVIR